MFPDLFYIYITFVNDEKICSVKHLVKVDIFKLLIRNWL